MENFLGISLGNGPLEFLFLLLLVMLGLAVGLLWPLGDKKSAKDKKNEKKEK